MAESASYPTSLSSLFDDASSLKGQFDPVRLADAEVVPTLQLPLAKEVFGQNVSSEDAIKRVLSGEISFTTFVAEKAKSLSDAPIEGLTQEQQRSQLLHIGVAALFAFLQSNVTGPTLNFKPADVVLPSALRSEAASLRGVRDQIIRELSVDGEAAYKLTPNAELFAVAKALLVDADVLLENGPVVARTVRMRTNFLHQKMLSEVTGALQDSIYQDLEELSKMLLGDGATSTAQDKSRFLLERATIHTHHGFDAKAREDLERAAAERHFEFALTGKMGKRTKFQERDTSQLVILAKSAGDDTSIEIPAPSEKKEDSQPSKPKNLDLNDDTLLESISFTKNDDTQSQEKSVTIQDESGLSPALASLDPGNQPTLDPVDSSIILALASAITNTTPENGLTREETHPYATRVLEGGSSNWQVYTQALLLRSRIEGYRSRTVERSVLQMQALVDQVIADTAALNNTDSDESYGQPTTFLPKPEKDESASATERLEYIWLLSFQSRWDLESELAGRWVNLGGLRTALDIYERLQMWAEAALCYAATDNEEKAKQIVRCQLYEPTNKDTFQGDNETFEGPELSPLPANAPRLFCILGDIQTDPTMYERAWDISGQRYARAQRSLARHYLTLTPPALEKAEEAYRKSLHINRLNHSAWFALGCVQLELKRWDSAIESFMRTVQLEDTDAEAWSNLAAAMLRTSKPAEETPTNQPAPRADDEDDSETPKAPEDPHKQKREALAALQRAAQLKNTDVRIWDNVLTVAASIPPPYTPFREVVTAQRRLIELLGPKSGEKSIDVPIVGMLVDHLVTYYQYEELLIKAGEDATSSTPSAPVERVVRSGTIPGQILSLLDNSIVPLITHSAPLWLLVSRVEQFREQPSKALEAHEKAWRATVASSAQGAFQMGEEKKWLDVVKATERLVLDGYSKYGPMDKEGQDGDGEELVAKDWRFKSRSAIRGIMGKGKEFWEDSEGWDRLKELQVQVGSAGA